MNKPITITELRARWEALPGAEPFEDIFEPEIAECELAKARLMAGFEAGDGAGIARGQDVLVAAFGALQAAVSRLAARWKSAVGTNL